jgi:hypothetical protein
VTRQVLDGLVSQGQFEVVDEIHAQLGRLGPAPEPVKPARAMSAEQGKPGNKWLAWILMTASRDMKRDLKLARLHDGIDVTAPQGMIHVTTRDDVVGDVVFDLLRQSQD